MGFRRRGVVIEAWYIKDRPRWMTPREFLEGIVTWSSLVQEAVSPTISPELRLDIPSWG